jgi:hypothetical protein
MANNFYRTAGFPSPIKRRIHLLAVMEIVETYQESGGDVRDKTILVPAQGSSRRPPIPGAANAAYAESPVSINAAIRESPNSSNTEVGLRSQASEASNGPVVEELRDHQLLTAPQQQSTAVTKLCKDCECNSKATREEERRQSK